MKVFSKPLTAVQVSALGQTFGEYLKVTVDLAQKIMVVGCVLHADGEQVLLEKFHSHQEDVWGGGIDLKAKAVDTTAVLNIRSSADNPSLEILNSQRRDAFVGMVKEFFAVVWA